MTVPQRPAVRAERLTSVLRTQIFDIVREGLVIEDELGRVVGCNPAAESMLGLDPGRLSGRTTHDGWRALHPDGGPLPDVELPSVIARRTLAPVLDRTIGIERHDGSVAWVVMNATPLLEPADGTLLGVVLSLVDVTDRKVAETQLESSERMRRASLDALTQGVALVGLDGGTAVLNGAGERLLGVDAEELRNLVLSGRWTTYRPTGEVLPLEERPIAWTLRTGEAMHDVAVGYQHPDGRRLQLLLSTQAVCDTVGRVTGVAVAFQDITDAANAESQVAAARQSERRAQDRLAWQAFHDQLTGLPNRALLMDRLQRAIVPRLTGQGCTALLFIDLDRFKIVNDTLGHAAGDELLVAVAKRLVATTRPGDTVARLGGDEFVVLAEHLRDSEEARTLARRLNCELAEPVELSSGSVSISASIGIAFDMDHRADTILRDADDALYRAKARGKDRFEVFDDDLRTEAARRVATERLLRRALDEDGITVHYQPVVHLATGVAFAAEALLRVPDEDGHLGSPTEFVLVAEEAGLIVTVGAGVLDEACRQLRAWRGSAGAPRQMAVNTSARQLSSVGFVELVRSTLRRHEIEPADLVLEFTESTVISADSQTARTIGALHELGVKLAIDDFGTGYSSLQYLRRFPIDIVKIDRSFVRGLDINPGDTEIVRAVIALGHNLDLETVAEGIETEQQLAALKALGCDHGQGYLLGRPAPPNDTPALLTAVTR